MITLGVDFSKRNSVYHVLDNSGCTMSQTKVSNEPLLIKEFFDQLPAGPKQLAMEATRNWGLFYEEVTPYVDHFYLGHPKKMKAITESETKNDQRDAEMIARLTFAGFLPKAHVSSLDIRQLRSLLRFRHFLVGQRKALCNQIHILIDRNLWPSQRPQNFKDLFCKRGILWLSQVSLPQRERFILDDCLLGHAHLTRQINNLEAFVTQTACHLEGIRHLRTVPGFLRSVVILYIVLTETDDVNRFRKARHFAHYAGLIPREHSSGDKHRTGRLVKDANIFLRTAIIEAVFPALRADPGLRKYYQTVKARSGSGSAIIACARKLSYAIYYVLKERRPYRPFEIPPAAACHSAAVS